ncbi:MAG: dTDP-glucose 4,6-dehydratase [Nitrospinae bacterium]|nr:dTDP-glucose 4,6-dehydratase [Nitrospinota bacterium]
MKILITGGAGFIGSNYIKYMLKRYLDYKIVNLDKLTYAGNLDNLRGVEGNKNYTFVKGDIADTMLVGDIIKDVDVVINFAAETHVDRSISDPADFIKTDVYGTYVLLEAARIHEIERFIQISTDEVYGDAGDEPSKEDDPLMPRSPYAASKAGADRLAFSFWATYKTPVVITRCTNNYGYNQYPEKMIPLFVTNALEDKPLPVYGDGKNTRDWIFVEDHCHAIDIILHSDGIQGEVFNIGSGTEKSILEIADMILDMLGKSNEMIEFVEDRPGHVKRHAVNTEKLRSVLDWHPSIAFQTGMERTIEWYKENKGWWQKIKSGEYLEYYKRMYGKRRRIESR